MHSRAMVLVRDSVNMPRYPLLGRGVFGGAPRIAPSVLDVGEPVFTRSGRSAITLALRHAGIGPGASVLIPNYYCPTMAAPVELCGAGAVFYPLTRQGTPDLDWLRLNTPANARALLAAHFFGLPVALAPVRQFCDGGGIILLEDCAHAFFGASAQAPVGVTGDYAIASLPKFFPVIEGGVLTSRTRDLSALALPRLRPMAELKGLWNLSEVAARHRRLPGLNGILSRASRMLGSIREESTLEPPSSARDPFVAPARVREEGLADPLLKPMQLRRIERRIVAWADARRIVVRRQENYRYLAERVRGCAHARVLFADLPQAAVPYAVPIRAEAAHILYPQMRAEGLPVFRWDRYWPNAIDAAGDVGRDWGHHVLQVLCHQDLTLDDMERIAASVLRGAA